MGILLEKNILVKETNSTLPTPIAKSLENRALRLVRT